MQLFIKDIIEQPRRKLNPHISTAEAISLLVHNQLESVPVISESNSYLGVFHLGFVKNTSEQLSIKQSMITELTVLSPMTPITNLKPSQFSIPILPVVENGKLLGVVTINNFITKLLEQMDLEKSKLVSEIQDLTSELEFIKEKHSELEHILDNSYDGVAIANRDGITEQVNKAWDRLTGLKREDVIGVPLNQLVKKGYFSDSVTMKIINTNRPTTIFQKMKSGKQAVMTGSPIFDKEGNLHKVIINIRDITELYQLKKTLENKNILAEKYKAEITLVRLKQNNEESIIAESKIMRDVIDLSARVARVESTVSLSGESGVGKGVIARFIHQHSERSEQPFITINCGAIPPELLESELFGYVGGAFTGASSKGKIGMFELANNGTLFLDEIGEIPLNLQVKLLHVLQEKEVNRVGGTSSKKLNIRIISATNKDLLSLIDKGEFREDLYYRLSVVPLLIPPLRSRKEDITPLVAHYLSLYNKKYSMHKSVSSDLMNVMQEYDWPGNIRELSNMIERMMVTTHGDILNAHNFPHTKGIIKNQSSVTDDLADEGLPTLEEASIQLESELINKALRMGKTQIKAAELLGISLSTFIRKFKKVSEYPE